MTKLILTFLTLTSSVLFFLTPSTPVLSESKCSGVEKNCSIPPYIILKTIYMTEHLPMTVSFDASESFDEDGEIVLYEWDFGDETQGAGPIIEHTFTAIGDYLVELKVTDNSGKFTIETVLIQVRGDDQPLAKFRWATPRLSVSESAPNVDITLLLEPTGGTPLTEEVVASIHSLASLPSSSYQLSHQSFVFPPGQTSATISLTLTSNPEVTGDEVIVLLVDQGALEPRLVIEMPRTMEVTVEDDDLEIGVGCLDQPGSAFVNYNGQPGGWVASSADVHPMATIGAGAQVCGNSSVSSNSEILGEAIIWDTSVSNSKVQDNAYVVNSIVRSSIVGQPSIVSGHALIYSSLVAAGSTVSDHARVINVKNGDVFSIGLFSTNVSGSAYLSNISMGVIECIIGDQAKVYRMTQLTGQLGDQGCQVGGEALLLRGSLGTSSFRGVASGSARLLDSQLAVTSVDGISPQVLGNAVIYRSDLYDGAIARDDAFLSFSLLGGASVAGGSTFLDFSTFCDGEVLIDEDRRFEANCVLSLDETQW